MSCSCSWLEGMMRWVQILWHLHTKLKVVNELSNRLSPKQLYGCHPKSCQSCQRWQPKSCSQDIRLSDNPLTTFGLSMWQLFGPNFALRDVKKGTVTVTTLTTLKLWIMTTFWQLVDNLAFCVFLLIHQRIIGRLTMFLSEPDSHN